jgi:beta-mannosidase
MYIFSDQPREMKAELSLQLMDFTGKNLWSYQTPIQIEPLTSKAYFAMEERDLLQGHSPQTTVLQARLLDEQGRLVGSSLYYFVQPKALELSRPNIVATLSPGKDGTYQILLTTDHLAKNVFLSGPQGQGVFSDNFFDLLPGQPLSLTYRGTLDRERPQSSIGILSLVDTY